MPSYSYLHSRSKDTEPVHQIRQVSGPKNSMRQHQLNNSSNKKAVPVGSNSYAIQNHKSTAHKQSIPGQSQQQTSQTSHMISILSSSQQMATKNNTMTLIRGGSNNRGVMSSLGPNTTIYGEESLIENGEIEEMHYLSVRVERMKKAMLNRVEGIQSEIKSGSGKNG